LIRVLIVVLVVVVVVVVVCYASIVEMQAQAAP
jgi:hypothetical protein